MQLRTCWKLHWRPNGKSVILDSQIMPIYTRRKILNCHDQINGRVIQFCSMKRGRRAANAHQERRARCNILAYAVINSIVYRLKVHYFEFVFFHSIFSAEGGGFKSTNAISNDVNPRPKPAIVRTTTQRTTARTTATTTTTKRPAPPKTTKRPRVPPKTTRRPTLQDIFGKGGQNSNSNRFQPPRRGPSSITTAQTTPRPRPTRRPRPTNQRTTTELSVRRPTSNKNRGGGSLFTCDFERNTKECEVKFSSKNWQMFKSGADRFYEIILNGGQRSEIFFSQMVPPPTGGVACLTFRYRKFLDSKFIRNVKNKKK